jgi:predicted metal-dependent peptidase
MTKAAAREEVERLAQKAVLRARIALMRSSRRSTLFFVARLFDMPCEPLWTVQTAATDGRRIVYNPEFFTSLSPHELQGVLLHEVAHVVFGHHLRRCYRDAYRWNIACDLAINHLLAEAGITLPDAAIYPGILPYQDFPIGQEAEKYYELLSQQSAGDDGQGGGKYPDPGRCGGVFEPGSGSKSDLAKAAQDNRQANAVAAQIAERLGGFQPSEDGGNLERAIRRALKGSIDWAALLREFVLRVTHDDHNWLLPNRRLLSYDVYAPTLRQEEVGKLAVLVDISGSISDRLFEAFIAELNNLGVALPGIQATVIYHDSRVCRVEDWAACDGPYKPDPVPGGGGTDHRPAFAQLQRHLDAGEPYVAVVCLTDMLSEFPSKPPDLPTLWVVYNNANPVVPWGELAHVEPIAP